MGVLYHSGNFNKYLKNTPKMINGFKLPFIVKVMNSKQEIRKQIQTRFRENQAYCTQINQKIRSKETVTQIVRMLTEKRQYKTIFGFAELQDEFPCLDVLDAFLHDAPKKNIGLPLVSGKDLIFKQVGVQECDIRKELTQAHFGILEPRPESNTLFSTQEDFYSTQSDAVTALSPLLVLTPGRAFTHDGKRLGRGGGYYDKLFSILDLLRRTHKHFIFDTVGLAYHFQIYDKLPIEQFDYTVDTLYTEKDILHGR
ncbi:MAG: hypothetical protein IJU92_03165 [Spirochaetaceae bacterium]|nr:hypothetical protein [Spirochaetaceae bacterium]